MRAVADKDSVTFQFQPQMPAGEGFRWSSFGSIGLAACVRDISEIPPPVIDGYRRHFIRLKRNFLVPADLYNAALTRNDLLESSTVPEFKRNHLITYACLCSSFQEVDKLTRSPSEN